MIRHHLALLWLAATLTACGGGGGDGTVPARCSVNDQKIFVRDVTNEWYLFPETLPAQVNVANFDTPQQLLDYMTAVARAQDKDRYFSYVTTKEEDSSFLQEGEFIGFGFRLRIDGSRVYFMEAFENSPASEADMSRGDELLTIDSGSGPVPVANILATDPNLSNALGPATVGVTRGFGFVKLGGAGVTSATLAKRIITIQPIPDDGVAVVNLPPPYNTSVKVGYVNLRTYITTAATPLRDAFLGFRNQGINYFIVDLRYNGGGLISIADLMGDLFGQQRSTSEVYSRLSFRASKSSNDVTHFFQPQAQSVDPVRIAFITTGGSASASEMTVNSMKPWAEVAIVGTDTYGKPVGQSAFDLSDSCDLRLRLVTFRGTNSDGEGDYYDGLASTLPFACAASDELQQPMGDPAEDSTAEALRWLGSGACSSVIAGVPTAQKPGIQVETRYPVPEHPTPAQVHLPGLY